MDAQSKVCHQSLKQENNTYNSVFFSITLPLFAGCMNFGMNNCFTTVYLAFFISHGANISKLYVITYTCHYKKLRKAKELWCKICSLKKNTNKMNKNGGNKLVMSYTHTPSEWNMYSIPALSSDIPVSFEYPCGIIKNFNYLVTVMYIKPLRFKRTSDLKVWLKGGKYMKMLETK